MKPIILHVRDLAEQKEVEKYLKFPNNQVTIVHGVVSDIITDANGVQLPVTTANANAMTTIREATAAGIPVYSTGIYPNNADGVGDVTFIDLFVLKNKMKSRPGTIRCMLCTIKDGAAFEALKTVPEYALAFGLQAADETGEEAAPPF
jgi:hypothetical protein